MKTKGLSTWRLALLRGMYLFMAVGLFLTVWPTILFPPTMADQDSVIRALLGAIGLLSLVGLRYPVKMIPLLLFELLWKVIWILGSALPMMLGPGLDQYASESLFACVLGVILVPVSLPWGYVVRRYVVERGERSPISHGKLTSS